MREQAVPFTNLLILSLNHVDGLWNTFSEWSQAMTPACPLRHGLPTSTRLFVLSFLSFRILETSHFSVMEDVIVIRYNRSLQHCSWCPILGGCPSCCIHDQKGDGRIQNSNNCHLQNQCPFPSKISKDFPCQAHTLLAAFPFVS